MNIPLDEVIHFDVVTSDSSGAAVDADSTPTWAIFEEATDTAIQTGNFTKRTSLDGEYRGTNTASAANGYEVGKWYHVKGYATVDSVAGKAVVWGPFRIVPAETQAGVPKVDVSHSLGAALFASDFTIASATASTVTLPTTYTNGDSLPDDDRHIYTALSVVGGTGAGQVVVLTTAAAGARTYDVLSGTMPVQLDNTSTCVVLGVGRPSTTALSAMNVFFGVTTDYDVELLQSDVETIQTTATVISNKLGTLTDLGNGNSTVAGNLQVIEAQTDDIGTAGAGLTAIPWNAAWDAEVQSEATDALNAYDPPTNAEMEARTLVAANYFDPAADTVANVTTVGSVTGLTASNLDATVSSRATPAQVNTEVLDVLTVDTFAQPGQEAPAATTTLGKMLAYLYKAFRNKKTQTATTRSLYADDAVTVDQKATDSDDATTYTKGELGAGP